MLETPTFAHAAVAASHHRAAQTGTMLLAEGGNAIEAMVGMAATIAVVYPHMNGIGGDGFWLIREPHGRVHYIEACGPAGALATREYYRGLGFDSIPARGIASALTVPGAIGGWQLALQLAKSRGGRLPLALLLADAIRLAADGYPISACEARYRPKEFAALTRTPGFAEAFLVEGKAPPQGTQRRAEKLAASFSHLAAAGLDDFYRGDVASEMAKDMTRLGCPIARPDLEAYRAVWRTPLSLPLKGYTLFNSPPPTQGLASLVLLGTFAELGVKDSETFAHIHGLVESTKRAFAVRDRVCTDFERLSSEPSAFLSPQALAGEAARIDPNRAQIQAREPEQGGTIWMGAIDPQGLAISYIQSIYWEYGSGCVLPGTGVLLQNRGMAFSLDRASLNPLEPGRRPFHTLNPPICVFADGRVMPYGSMGGDGQPQFQAQIFSRALMGASLAEALDRPRFLYGRLWGTPSASLKLENRFDPAVVEQLRRAGHEIEETDQAYSDLFGHAGMLVRHPAGPVEAAHDPRSDGAALGL